MITEYWINPQGKIIPIDDHPIRTIISKPQEFGYNIEMMQIIYAKFNDVNQAEGEATATIIRDLISKGWLYCFKKNRQKEWRVEVHRLDKKTRFNLRLWIELMLRENKLTADSEIKIYRYFKDNKMKRTVTKIIEDNIF